jgi:hypothetical protein
MKPRLLDLRNILFLVGIAFQVSWYALLWIHNVPYPKALVDLDFLIFYTAGRIAASGRYDLIYDIQTQRQIQEQLRGETFPTDQLLPFNHPPLLVPIQQLISINNYTEAYFLWDLIMVFFLVATALMIARLFKKSGWDGESIFIIILSSLLFYPIFVSLLRGQDTAFLLLGATLWVYGILTKKDSIAGLGLAMTTIRPQIALMLGVPFLFNRRKVLGWAVFGGSIHLFILALLSLDGLKRFVSMLLISARGGRFFIYRERMFNMIGLIYRFFPRLDNITTQVIIWGAFLLVAIILCILWARSQELQIKHVCLALILSVFAAPHLYSSDLSLLILPILGLVLAIVKARTLSLQTARYIPITFCVPMALMDLKLFGFLIPYVIMVVLALFLWFPGWLKPAWKGALP